MKAFLFDLDGTLLNTLPDIAAAMNWALARHQLAVFPEDAYRQLVGNGARVLAERAVRERQELAEQVLADYQGRYETHCTERTRPYPGMPETLRALQEAGLRLCVLSNKPDADTRHVIARYYPEIAFDAVQGGRPGVPLKPDPAAALGLCEKLGLTPADFLYAGDSGVDMTCARRAGMTAVGVTWGFRGEDELRAAGADHIVHAPQELLRLIREEP